VKEGCRAVGRANREAAEPLDPRGLRRDSERFIVCDSVYDSDEKSRLS
jgi:hypothetical protein